LRGGRSDRNDAAEEEKDSKHPGAK
jgi:hypothetical protein